MTLPAPTTEEGQDMSAQDDLARSDDGGDAKERATLKAGRWAKLRTIPDYLEGRRKGSAYLPHPYPGRLEEANAEYAADLRALLALVEENERLQAKVTQAAEWFEEYADHHQAKGALDKASRNLERANYLRRSSALGGDQQ